MNLSNIQELVGLANAADMLENKNIQKLLYSIGLDYDKEMIDDAKEIFSYKILGKIIAPDPFDPAPRINEVSGDIEIGITRNGSSFGLLLKELPQHILLAGRSGSGKTTILYNMMNQLLEKNIHFWCFDSKREFRGFTREREDVLVVKPEDLKFNPLRPPEGISPLRWASVFSDVFSNSARLLEGSNSFLLDQVFNLYNLFEVFDGSNKYPSLHELMETLNHTYFPLSSRDSRYLEVVKNRVKSCILTAGDMVDCDEDMVDELLNQDKSIVFEFYGLSEHIATFLIEMLLTKLYYYRIVQGRKRSKERPLVVFMDEGRNIYDYRKEKTPESGIPIIDTITERIRDFNVGLVICTQIPSEICASAKSNTYCKMMMSLVNGKDIFDLSKCMGLDENQARFNYNLDVGNAIVKLAGRRTSPFWITTPNIEIEKDVSDFELQQRMRPMLSTFNITNVSRTMLYDSYISSLKDRRKVKKSKSISKETNDLLISILRNPFIPVTSRYDSLDLSRKKGKIVKDYLIENGLVIETNIKVSNNIYNFLLLTKKGFSYCKERGFDDKVWNEIVSGKISFRHRFYQFYIKNLLTQNGWDVIIENRINGNKRVDVVARYGHKRIAIEIAVTKFEINDITKCINDGFDEVRVICKDKTAKERIETTINGSIFELNGTMVIVQTINNLLSKMPKKR